jgi:hypothetical protein
MHNYKIFRRRIQRFGTNILAPSTQECSPKAFKLSQRKDQASLQQAKQTARASAPETAAFHGATPASSPAQEAAASLPEQWTRGRRRALGRVRRTDNGEEVGAVPLEGASGRRRTDGRKRAMLFFLLCFAFAFSFEVMMEETTRSFVPFITD